MAEFGDIGESLGDLSHGANAIELTEFKFPESAIQDAVSEINTDDLLSGLRSGDLEAKGGTVFNTTTGEVVDLSKVSDDLQDGNIIEVAEELGLPEEKIPPEVKSDIPAYEEAAKNLPINQTINLNVSLEDYAKKADNDVGVPKSGDDIEKLMKNDEKFEKEIKKLQEDAKDKGESKIKKASKWFKRLVVVAAAGAIGYELYEKVHDHACDMAGCWLVNIKSGEKCKIKSLSCGGNANDTCGTTTFPTPECKNGVCLDGSPCDSTKQCGPCIKWKGDCTADKKTDCCAKNQDPNTCCDKTAPSSCSGGTCGSFFSSSGGNCSDNCNSKNIHVPKGYKLVCNQGSFWAAWKDLGLPDPFSGSGIFSKIFHIIFAIVIFVVILIVVYGLFKFAGFVLR